MSTQGEAPSSLPEKISESVEDYRITVLALLSLVSILTWNRETRQQLPNTRYSFGRKMDKEPEDGSKPRTVTPDAVIQQGTQLGFVVEAKKSLPQCDDYWRKDVGQLQKYASELVGWWTDESERIVAQCTILLLDVSFTARFADYIERLRAEEGLSFDYPVAIVEFVHRSRARQFIFLRRHWGEVKDIMASRQLDRGCDVPVEDVIATYGPKKFYDSRPPTEYTMSVLWQDIFNGMKVNAPYDQVVRAYPIPVTVGKLTSDLRRLYGSTGDERREVAVPRIKWVREAMEGFVSLGLAKPGQERDEYTVLFRRLRGDLIQRFGKHRRKRRSRDKQATQLTLFGVGVGEDERELRAERT